MSKLKLIIVFLLYCFCSQPALSAVVFEDNNTPVEQYGRLNVCGTQLCDQYQTPVQLVGMSTHGLQWYGWGNCLTPASLDVLAHDWQVDIVRLSLYVQEGGYETDPQGFTEQVQHLIEQVSQRGRYVLIDWHQLSPGDPNYNLPLAKQFFKDIAQANQHRNNIIYDIANEPNGVAWADIHRYASQMIPWIRQFDADALILVGTHGWASLGVSDGGSYRDILDMPLEFDNIMYSFHFYAASHRDYYRNMLDQASDVLPIFVTEWGTQTYTGDGDNDFYSADLYVKLMNQKKISWINWNYSDDFRSGAVWKTGSCYQDTWSNDQLKPAGKWIKAKIQQAHSKQL